MKRCKLGENKDEQKVHELRPLLPVPIAKNIEDEEVSHLKMASNHPELLKYLVTNPTTGAQLINLKNEESVRLYNQALLYDWFGIKIELPPGHLCPTVLSRTRYIRWIAELLKHCGQEEKIGIDVGTGASCVYPLIGHAAYGWKFISSDVDDESLEWASKNVKLNNWTDFIAVVKAKEVAPHSPSQSGEDKTYHILDGLLNSDSSRIRSGSVNFEKVHFSMCNPPYFDRPEDKIERHDTVCIATDGELATSGGEVEFVKQMIRESAELKSSVSWYTTLLGKKSSVQPLLRYLKTFNPAEIRHTTFIQGRNSRWAIAWTFDLDVKASLVAERASSIRYTDKKFAFESSHATVESVERALAENSFGLKFRKQDASSSATLLAALYTSSDWLSSQFTAEAVPSATNSGIGPASRPSTLFSFKLTMLQSSNTKNISLTCELVPGTLNTVKFGEIEYSAEHVFGILARELRALLGR